MTPASRKKSARKPRMAKTLDVKTINGSFVSAKIAGTLSTAKTMSVISMNTRHTNSGVACQTPLSRVRKLCPCSRGVTGSSFRSRRMTGFFSGSMGFSGAKRILMPVRIRKPPKSQMTQWNCISTEPRLMKMMRKKSAPRMP